MICEVNKTVKKVIAIILCLMWAISFSVFAEGSYLYEYEPIKNMLSDIILSPRKEAMINEIKSDGDIDIAQLFTLLDTAQLSRGKMIFSAAFSIKDFAPAEKYEGEYVIPDASAVLVKRLERVSSVFTEYADELAKNAVKVYLNGEVIDTAGGYTVSEEGEYTVKYEVDTEKFKENAVGILDKLPLEKWVSAVAKQMQSEKYRDAMFSPDEYYLLNIPTQINNKSSDELFLWFAGNSQVDKDGYLMRSDLGTLEIHYLDNGNGKVHIRDIVDESGMLESGKTVYEVVREYLNATFYKRGNENMDFETMSDFGKYSQIWYSGVYPNENGIGVDLFGNVYYMDGEPYKCPTDDAQLKEIFDFNKEQFAKDVEANYAFKESSNIFTLTNIINGSAHEGETSAEYKFTVTQAETPITDGDDEDGENGLRAALLIAIPVVTVLIIAVIVIAVVKMKKRR